MELELFGNGWDLLEVALRAIIMYLFAVGLLRIFGKRTTMTTASFDLIVTVALGSLLASTIISTSRPLVQGMAAIAALVALQWVLSLGVSRSSIFERVVVSPARMLLKDGQILRANLREERLSTQQLEQSLRHSGYASKRSLQAAILESNGAISVIGQTEDSNELIEEEEIGSRSI